MIDNSFKGMKAFEFPNDLSWINTDRPLSMEQLKGKLVLLDFWTYCCINCIHVIPDLHRLEEKYPELVIIGVHSAKYSNEQIKGNIKEAVLRYEIHHPVIIDNNFIIWENYLIKGWPSFILISPDSRILLKTSGEGVFDKLNSIIEKYIQEYKEKGLIRNKPLILKQEKTFITPPFLLYPGKISSNEESGQLFISDSNHNRIIIAKEDGTIETIIGSGEKGLDDGDFSRSSFYNPQGTHFDKNHNLLYIMDTGNHLVRCANLEKQKVHTILGTGKQATNLLSTGQGKKLPLNSPWDCTIKGDDLYIAMAGSHQIWKMNTKSYEASVFAGTGLESIVDGEISKASLAQPSAICSDEEHIYILDSETSSVRCITDNRIQTLIGSGLFDFGDVDGGFNTALLQHPLGIYKHFKVLYIADTYNHKIKAANLEDMSIRNIAGTGEIGLQDGLALSVRFNEPGGITYLNGKFYIADTNNHCVRVYDPITDSISTLNINQAQTTPSKKSRIKLREDLNSITLSPHTISPDCNQLIMNFTLKQDYQWKTEFPFYFEIHSEPNILFSWDKLEKIYLNQQLILKIPISVQENKSGKLQAHVVLYYCDENNQGLCHIKNLDLIVPLIIHFEGENKLMIDYQVERAE